MWPILHTSGMPICLQRVIPAEVNKRLTKNFTSENLHIYNKQLNAYMYNNYALVIMVSCIERFHVTSWSCGNHTIRHCGLQVIMVENSGGSDMQA